MSVRVTHVRMSGGTDHQHITHYRWIGIEDGQVDSSSRAVMVDWIDRGGSAFVVEGGTRTSIGVVRPVNGIAYLRTHADGNWTNNLLALPRF